MADNNYANLKIQNDEISVVLPFSDSYTTERKYSLEEFFDFAEKNPDLLCERNANGKITFMTPVKNLSGHRESVIGIYVGMWWLNNGEKGILLSSSTGVRLKDDSVKSPDSGWISPAGIGENSAQQIEETFAVMTPDFVVEVRSFSDSLKGLKKKMETVWMKNGVKLAWLIDAKKETVYIYRQGKSVEIVKGFKDKILSGEGVMPKFEFPLSKLILKL